MISHSCGTSALPPQSAYSLINQTKTICQNHHASDGLYWFTAPHSKLHIDPNITQPGGNKVFAAPGTGVVYEEYRHSDIVRETESSELYQVNLF